MARVTQGKTDSIVDELLAALNAYEAATPDSEASLYRYNPASVRLRIISPKFDGMNRSERHKEVVNFLRQNGVSDDALSDVALLLLLTEAELPESTANREFEQPVPSLI